MNATMDPGIQTEQKGRYSLGSAILIVADVVEAISSHRPYRPALGIDLKSQK